MILRYENNMVSIPDDAIWQLRVKQTDAYRWSLVLQVNDKVVDKILDSEEFIDIDQSEKEARDEVLAMFSRVIFASALAMSRENNDDDVFDLGPVLVKEITAWTDDRKNW